MFCLDHFPPILNQCHSKEAKVEAENSKAEEKVEPPKAWASRGMECVCGNVND